MNIKKCTTVSGRALHPCKKAHYHYYYYYYYGLFYMDEGLSLKRLYIF